MSRYIDAELVPALFDEEFKETRKLISQGETHLDNLAEGFTEADRVIRKIPTADVAEVKHARWLPSPDGVCPIRCSSCNTPALWCHGEDDFGYAERRYASHFCPYCGARMDEIKKAKKIMDE